MESWQLSNTTSLKTPHISGTHLCLSSSLLENATLTMRTVSSSSTKTLSPWQHVTILVM